MSHQVAVFRFTLGHDQSIGPATLQALWQRAAESEHVSVGRMRTSYQEGGRPVYTLYGPSGLQDLEQVQARLRVLLDERGLRASLVAMQVV